MFQTDNEYVGQIIKEVRDQRGYKQQELAEEIGVTPSVMSKIEGGKRAADIQELVHISEKLNVRLEYLLGIDRDIDDDEHMVNLFLGKFFRVITTKSFCKNRGAYTPEDIEDLFYAVPGQYVIFEGSPRTFSFITQVAIANSCGKMERDARIKEALNKYREGKDKRTDDRYFLLSKMQMQKLVKEYAKAEKAEKVLHKILKNTDKDT